jgi:hypothetical protein
MTVPFRRAKNLSVDLIYYASETSQLSSTWVKTRTIAWLLDAAKHQAAARGPGILSVILVIAQELGPK